ncbi:ankyrin repeat domain-containing protein [Marinobacter fuscus]|uniref:ankyrin repeat domain-containing protein n=1 Tax=Marinobacter fuscus TaxID=2109942 RepID=UPI0013FE4420|nr:ankyrin repeat domain-containing protein [Marinobacter fuscus]
MVIKAALSSGADINGFSLITGYTALHEAVLINEPELVEILISLGANPGIKDRNQGRTAADLLSAIIEQNPHLNMKAIELQIKN